jgi:hypothetical protein
MAPLSQTDGKGKSIIIIGQTFYEVFGWCICNVLIINIKIDYFFKSFAFAMPTEWFLL